MSGSFDGVRVLFLCLANSARSPIAERLAPGFLSGVVASSAGQRPAREAHPYAVEVLRELGLDLAGYRPRDVAEVDPAEVDLVVTLCAEDVRPEALRGKPWIAAPIADPAQHAMEFSRAMAIEGFRSAREDIEDALRAIAARGPRA